MYGLLNIASLLLGLAAWALPIAAIIRKRNTGPFTGISFGLCSLSLLFQLVYTQHLVDIRDWSALEDTHCAVVCAAVVLLSATLLLNIAAALTNRTKP